MIKLIKLYAVEAENTQDGRFIINFKSKDIRFIKDGCSFKHGVVEVYLKADVEKMLNEHFIKKELELKK